MKRYKCEKHGFLEPSERVMWNQGSFSGRWCVHCVNEMMDKFCGKLIIVEGKETDENKKEMQ